MYSNFRRIVILLIFHFSFGERIEKNSENGFELFPILLDVTQDPCQNFYGYACGNWLHALDEPHGEPKNLEGYLKHRYIELLANGFEKRIRTQTSELNSIYKKAQEFYDSCHKTPSLKVFQYVDVLREKHDDLKWLNILHNGNVTLDEKHWNWLQTLGRLHSYGFNNALISMNLIRCNAESSIIEFGKPENLEFDAIEQLAVEPLEPKFRAELLNFKQKLGNINKKEENMKSTILSFDSFAELFSLGNINDFFETLPKTLSREKLEFQIDDVQYLQSLQSLLSETSNNVVAFFVGLKFVSYLRIEMPKSLDPVDCLHPIQSQVPELLNLIYDQQYYSGQREKNNEIIDKIFQNLKAQYLKIFAEYSESLDKVELTFLQQKITHMQLNIGQIPLNADMTFYENYFNELKVETENLDSFYRNHLNLMSFRVGKGLEMLNMKANEPAYIFYGHRNAPMNDIFANIVFYPFALLEKPIFDPEENPVFHYAGIASIIAHDMAHAFDSNGLQYDFEGNPSGAFMKVFKENQHIQSAIACLQNLATTRLDEKFTDFAGFRVAYDIYFDRFKSDTSDMIPLHMTREEVFFVKFSQFYCMAGPPTSNGEAETWLSQVVMNNEEFYRVFNCTIPKNYKPCKFL